MHAEITIDGDDHMARIEFAHSNQAEVRQIRLAVAITAREFRQMHEVTIAVEPQAKHLILQQFENVRTRLKLKGSFGQDGFASQQRLGNLLGNLDRPGMMSDRCVERTPR
jgi:hypothetical protein